MVSGARGLRILAVVGAVLLSGCAEYRNHGYVPEEVNLARIEIGDRREEVATVIGQPSVTGLLEDNAWFYVRSRYRDYAWRAPIEISREVVLITFANDRVTNIEHYGLEDGRIVPISSRVTDPSTAGVPFLRQLFGNIGNVGASALGQ
jgi:outer membrane protein assembly factor BamE (lipoprotein component of BamABCDE complex)